MISNESVFYKIRLHTEEEEQKEGPKTANGGVL